MASFTCKCGKALQVDAVGGAHYVQCAECGTALSVTMHFVKAIERAQVDVADATPHVLATRSRRGEIKMIRQEEVTL